MIVCISSCIIKSIKINPYSVGFIDGILTKYDTRHPAAEPLPGPGNQDWLFTFYYISNY